jgi:hypothetical protein
MVTMLAQSFSRGAFPVAALVLAACSSSGGTGPAGTGGSTSGSTTGSGATTGTGTGTSTTSGTGTGGSSGAGGACATQPTFTEVLAKPLSGCAGLEPPCHNFNAGSLKIDPSNDAATWAQLVGVPAYIMGAGVRVVPGDPAHSFLYRKLTNDLTPSEGSPMPKSGLANGWNELPASEIEMVRCWILAGAADG